MSTLISSAVSGKKAAPKGAPRRRGPPPPPTPPAQEATPVSVSSAHTSVAPPSPPPTQPTATPVAPLREQSRVASEPGETPAPDSDRHEQSVARIGSEAPLHQDQQPIVPPSREVSGAPPTSVEPAIEHDDQLSAVPPQSLKRKAALHAPEPPTEPSKRAKRTSARSNAQVQSQIHDEETLVATNGQAPAQGDVRESSLPDASTDVAATEQTKPTRRKPKRKSAATVVDSDGEGDVRPSADDETTTADAPARKGRRKTASTTKRRSNRKPQPRTETPINISASADDVAEAGAAEEAEQGEDDVSDPELHEIDPNTVTMYGLSYDRRHGKTSEREKKMAEIDWVEVARKRYAEIEAATAAAAAGTTVQPAQPTDVRETTEGPSGTAESRSELEQEAQSAKQTAQEETIDPPADLPGFRIVDGQIVTDETNLVIDRVARAEEEAAETTVPLVEDNDLTRKVNNMSWINSRRRDVADRIPHSRSKSDPWSEEETERFYEALRMFGTDFYLISKMFPPKTRKMIKLKFIREERLDLARVNATLMGQKTTGKSFDLEFYARETGRDVSEFKKYDDAEHAERVIRESMKEREAAMQAAIRDEEEAEQAVQQAQVQREKNRKKMAEKRAEKGKEPGAEQGKGRDRKKKVAIAGGIGGEDGVTAGGDEG